MSRNNTPVTGGTGRGQGLSLLYHFTLKSHYERSLEQHPEFYRPPSGSDVHCAQSLQQLQQLIDNLDWDSFDERDRQSEGLLLCIDPVRAVPLIQSSGEDGLPILVLAIPTEAVVQKITIPQKEVKFQMPVELPAARSLPLRQRLSRAGRSALRALALAVLLGLGLATFPKLFPSESASQWLTYFLTNASFLVTLLVGVLAVIGCIYLLLPLSRAKVQLVLKEGSLVRIGDILRIVEPLDPGPDIVSSWMLSIVGVVFLTASLVAVSLWYRYTPLPAVQFQIERSGEAPYFVLADDRITLSPEGVMGIKVPLPPNLKQPSCRWSTAGESSLIYEHAQCQAVYWAQDTAGQDHIVVEVYHKGRWLTRASFTVAVESQEP
jgi:hypothetical protein